MPVISLLSGVDTSDLRQHCDRRFAWLDEKRRPWFEYCLEVAKHLIPNRLPYLLDPQGGQRAGEQNRHIVDAVGHLSLQTAAAGVTSGLMPPTSVWFTLSIRNLFEEDDDLKEFQGEAGKRLLALHNQSNANHVFPECQKEWLAFGTAAALPVEDDVDGSRIDQLSVGEYWIADDYRGRPDTLFRKLTLTVGQLVEEFGYDRLSASSQAAFDLGNVDQVVPCAHAIEPDRDGRNPYGNNPDLPWRSVYYEENDKEKVLAVRGFEKFPALVWRDGKLPGSPYGYGRGHDVLPHLVRLRQLIYRYGQALAFKSEPPVQTPPGVQHHEVRMFPGGRTTVFGQQKIENLFQVNLELKEVAEEIERTRQDIRDTLGATLVASLRRITQTMTAREAELRTTQDLAEFLPGLYRQFDELLSPYVEWLWDVAVSRGLLPELPDALDDGQEIDIEFTSPLARKQQQGEADAIIRTAAVAGEMAKSPALAHVVDNIDVDVAIRKIGRIEGAPADLFVPLEDVRKNRKARAQRELAMQQGQAAEQAVAIAKTAAEAGQFAQVA